MTSPQLVPRVDIRHLDQLWFQVAGTRCNLECHHCFISCGPKNLSFGFLSLEQVRAHLQDSLALGVKEYYFTGGEPFLNPEMTDILVETLSLGPATVLTNATVLKAGWLSRLADAEHASPYSLEFRVSIDGFTAETNDPIRGTGSFDRAMRGVIQLVDYGFMPIITAVRTWPEARDRQVLDSFAHVLRTAGYTRPRIKVLPTLMIGAEAKRSRPYSPTERISQSMMEGFDKTQLICHHSRIVTDRGVHVCPILIESPDSLLGQTLASAMIPFQLAHGACYTCYQFGAICSNPSSATRASAPPT